MDKVVGDEVGGIGNFASDYWLLSLDSWHEFDDLIDTRSPSP